MTEHEISAVMDKIVVIPSREDQRPWMEQSLRWMNDDNFRSFQAEAEQAGSFNGLKLGARLLERVTEREEQVTEIIDSLPKGMKPDAVRESLFSMSDDEFAEYRVTLADLERQSWQMMHASAKPQPKGSIPKQTRIDP